MKFQGYVKAISLEINCNFLLVISNSLLLMFLILLSPEIADMAVAGLILFFIMEAYSILHPYKNFFAKKYKLYYDLKRPLFNFIITYVALAYFSGEKSYQSASFMMNLAVSYFLFLILLQYVYPDRKKRIRMMHSDVMIDLLNNKSRLMTVYARSKAASLLSSIIMLSGFIYRALGQIF